MGDIAKSIKTSANLSALTAVFESRDAMLRSIYISQQTKVYELNCIVARTFHMLERSVANKEVDPKVATICEWNWNIADHGTQEDGQEAYNRVKNELAKTSDNELAKYSDNELAKTSDNKVYFQKLSTLYQHSKGTYWKDRLKEQRRNILRFLCNVVDTSVVSKLQEQREYATATTMNRIASECLMCLMQEHHTTLDDLQTALGRVWFLLDKAQTIIQYEGTGVYIYQFIVRIYHLANMKPTLEDNIWQEIQAQYATQLTRAEAAKRGR